MLSNKENKKSNKNLIVSLLFITFLIGFGFGLFTAKSLIYLKQDYKQHILNK